jgi:hypothetical protein
VLAGGRGARGAQNDHECARRTESCARVRRSSTTVAHGAGRKRHASNPEQVACPAGAARCGGYFVRGCNDEHPHSSIGRCHARWRHDRRDARCWMRAGTAENSRGRMRGIAGTGATRSSSGLGFCRSRDHAVTADGRPHAAAVAGAVRPPTALTTLTPACTLRRRFSCSGFRNGMLRSCGGAKSWFWLRASPQ